MPFVEKRVRAIGVMQAVLKEYEDTASGARHVHLATDDPEMSFLVAFPTVPKSSDGRAHILEHLALCGSMRYPVRDPFFSMLRRSTATFMNAMTYPDRTVYPFASADKADFFNLLDVYLDAAFFPRLDYLDFLQEGWRYTLDNNKLGYGGVVFNEMKGAFADPVRALAQGINEVLFKGTTYEVESGGDPLVIPSLTYDELKAFHASHYHPSQAVFMTAGNVNPAAIQQVIDDKVLSRLSGVAPRRVPELATDWAHPQNTTVNVPAVGSGDDEHGMQLAWRLGETADAMAYCSAYLLEAGLIGDASSPVMHAMESAGYGRPSALNGLDSGYRQMLFHIGMEGLTREEIIKARELVWQTLEKTAAEGVPHAALQAALRDLRFSQRQISGSRMPYGLRKLLHALPLEMAGSDSMIALDNEATFARMDEKISDPAYFRSLVDKLLVSPNRLDATVLPDPAYFVARRRIEEERLAAHQAGLSKADVQRIADEAAALLARQRTPADNSLLPRIRPEDVSPLPRPAYDLPAATSTRLGLRIASNGISYANVIYDVSTFGEEDWPWLDLYSILLPDLGVGEKTFADAAAWRQRLVPMFDVDLEADEPVSGSKTPLALRIVFSARNVREQQQSITQVLSQSINGARFDEAERIAFLVDSLTEQLTQELADSGDRYAAIAVEAPFSLRGHFEDRVEGIGALRFYQELRQQIESGDGLQVVMDRLTSLHARILQCPRRIIGAGVEQDGQSLADSIDLPGNDTPALQPAASPVHATVVSAAPANVALVAAAQVNHCFASWAVPRIGHEDSPVFSVLANLLTNQILHQALREEGGAYGGKARYSPYAGVFTMLSFRDPRLAATYQDFARAIDWVITSPLEREHIEEAIIGVIGDLDKPQTPYEEALHAWRMRERGVTPSIRKAFREGVLSCNADKLRRVAIAYLANAVPSRAAFTGSAEQDLAGLAPLDLQALAA